MGCLLKGGGGLHSRLVLGAVLLAAGEGRRLGGRPKPLLTLGGVPLVRRMLVALSGAGVDEVVVVLGHHAGAVGAAVQDFPVTLVHNPTPEAGQVSSLRAGLAALSGRLDAVIVALADQPLLHAGDITALIGAWKKRPPGVDVVYPQVDGQRGNPVIFGIGVRDEILAGEAHIGCRQWQATHPERVAPFVTDCRRYCVDVDTPEDLARFHQETGHALHWPA
jgi:molybdenum cofactor cytidylyltransferase